MTERETNPKVDAYFGRVERWHDELAKLRAMLLECPLVEDLKWGEPCYTSAGRNVVLIHGFKQYCALLFMQGSLLSDPDGLLIQQTANVQGGRQIRFTGLDEIVRLEPVLKRYVLEAIEVEKAGRRVQHKPTSAFAMPDEFKARLDGSPELKAAFEALTPGRQRAYLLHFSGAKQAKTREARIDKATPDMLAGKGLDD